MDPLENIRHFFALLFWYVGERKWTIQNTSTIARPRKEGEDYRPGDIVVAKFAGKQYRAVVVSVKDDKERLGEDSVKFAEIIKDDSLSPSEILERMGIIADLGSSSAVPNSDVLTTKPTQADKPPKKTSKPDVPAKKARIEKKKENPAAEIKQMQKQKKAAEVESSKLMAARMLKNSVSETDRHSGSASSSVPESFRPSPTTQSTSTPPTATVPLSPSTQRLHMNSTPSPTTQSDKHASINPSTTAVHSLSTQCPKVNRSQQSTTTQSTLDYKQASTVPSTTAVPSPSTQSQQANSNFQHQTPYLQQHYQPYNLTMPMSINQPNYYPNTDISGLWNGYGNGSASEYLANSLTGELLSPSTMDCSKCMVQIQSLQQRVKSLEEKVNALMPSQITHQSDTYVPKPKAPLLFDPEPCLESVPEPHHPVAEHSANTSVENQTSSNEVELVQGYGVQISVPQMDACLRKAKGSGTALARLLCNVFFDDATLGRSSARGTKTRPALDSKIVDAIIKCVEQRRKLSEADVVQAINQKCSDTRSSIKPVTKKGGH